MRRMQAIMAAAAAAGVVGAVTLVATLASAGVPDVAGATSTPIKHVEIGRAHV